MSQTSTTAEIGAPYAENGVGTKRQRRLLAVHSYGLTHRGKVRPSNEDQFLIAVLARALQVQQTSLGAPGIQYGADRGYLFAVADGMGGHAGGERASALVLESLKSFVLETLCRFLERDGSGDVDALAEFRKAIVQADERVCGEAGEHPELYGMGTTVTMAYSFRDELYVAHVGDSRCYLLRDGVLGQLTADQTMAQELVRAGLLGPDEAARHPWRHVITNAVGGSERGVQAEVHKARVQPGDCLLLCSDGLTEMLSDEDVAAVLEAEPDPRRACERLVAEANARGGRDNVTVVVARFSEAPAAPPVLA
jgi:protein phosphatase